MEPPVSGADGLNTCGGRKVLALSSPKILTVVTCVLLDRSGHIIAVIITGRAAGHISRESRPVAANLQVTRLWTVRTWALCQLEQTSIIIAYQVPGVHLLMGSTAARTTHAAQSGWATAQHPRNDHMCCVLTAG